METKSCSFSKVNSRVTLLNLLHLNTDTLKRANGIQENPYHERADTHTHPCACTHTHMHTQVVLHLSLKGCCQNEDTEMKISRTH